MKKVIFTLIFALIFTGLFQAPSFAVTSPPDIIAGSAVLIDAATGAILYEKDKDALKEPASVTKMMTCLLALENIPLHEVLTIDKESPFTGGSRIFIIEGEELTLEDLLYALMLESANDAAAALAIAVSGSIDDFAALMNERARELGAKNPSYKNPHGLHQEGHLTSAYDLAMVALEGMKNPEFRKIVSTYKYTIDPTNKQAEPRYMYNRNRLIYDELTKVPVRGVMTPAKYEGATGIKTGSTPQAGGTLVASAKRDGTELIAVVLASTDGGRFGDCIALLDYGFENYYTYKAVGSDLQIGDVKVKMGSFNHVGAKVPEDLYITLPKEASPSLITTKIVIDQGITAPVSEGQKLGRVEVYMGGDVISEAPVVAAADLPEGMFLSRFGIEDRVSVAIAKILKGILAVIILLFIAYAALLIRSKIKRRAKRRQKALEVAMERQRLQKETEQRKWPY